MSHTKPIARGTVVSLAVNGVQKPEVFFALNGPVRDKHSEFTRRLNGHDGDYLKTSGLSKGSKVFNWRSWTGLSSEEIISVQQAILYNIPVGCLLENITFSGIPNFSQLQPGTRLVFPAYGEGPETIQAILAIWEENGPCRTVGEKLEEWHGIEGLKTDFIREARGKRGVMGFVLSEGPIGYGDTVLVYPPVR